MFETYVRLDNIYNDHSQTGSYKQVEDQQGNPVGFTKK